MDWCLFNICIDLFEAIPKQDQEILQYINIIREAASHSATFTWRSYDEQFRLRQESEVESWGKINSDLWLRLMTSSTVTAPQASTMPNSSNTSKLDPTRVLGTCFDFNDGFCPRSYCKFKHVCSNCNNTNHERVTCFRQASSISDRENTNFRGPRGFNSNRGGPGEIPVKAWQQAVNALLLNPQFWQWKGSFYVGFISN